MSNFWGRFFQLFVGKKKKMIWKHCNVRTEKLHRKKVKKNFFCRKTIFFRAKNSTVGNRLLSAILWRSNYGPIKNGCRMKPTKRQIRLFGLLRYDVTLLFYYFSAVVEVALISTRKQDFDFLFQLDSFFMNNFLNLNFSSCMVYKWRQHDLFETANSLTSFYDSLHVFYSASLGCWITWFISSWEENCCCYKLTKLTNYQLVSLKISTRTILSKKQLSFCKFVQLVTTVISYSA